MLPIVFGYPSLELFEAEGRGEVALGGCLVSGEDPTHRCSACGQDVILDFDAGESALAACATCGLPLDGDPEDERAGDAGRPICGDCNRARNFDAIEEAELLDVPE
jgi:hypothetical protein